MLEEMGIHPYINAHDTYTVYGGSRMERNVLEAMREISEIFVDIYEVQRILGNKIATLTKNEGAYITNGAAGGLMLAAAVCMAKGSLYRFRKFPETGNETDEVILLHCQHNAYDKAIESSGARVIKIGDSDETQEYELEGAINDKTAAVFYFVSSLYERASMPLEKVIKITHEKGIPVVVDAAAQLPPVENFWKFTEMGADMVIFSGGKSLCGPQDSGVILGRKEWIEDCIRFGSPAHGICRSCKTSREAMAGLYAAIKAYMEKDQEKEYRRLYSMAVQIKQELDGVCGIRAAIIEKGPVGQRYPRTFLNLPLNISAEKLKENMKKRHIYIGLEQEHILYISPLNLKQQELETVIKALKSCLLESQGEC